MRLFSLFTLLAILNILQGQNALEVGFGHSQPGYSYRLGYVNTFNNKLSVEVGLKYIQWNAPDAPDEHLFKDRFKPENFIEHLGAYGGVDYNFKTLNDKVSLFCFYNLIFTRSSLYVNLYSPFAAFQDTITGEVYTLYKELTDQFEPAIALEHYVGAGFVVSVTKNLYIKQKIGGGIVQYFDLDPRILLAPHENWEVAWLWNIGVGYRFNKD